MRKRNRTFHRLVSESVALAEIDEASAKFEKTVRLQVLIAWRSTRAARADDEELLDRIFSAYMIASRTYDTKYGTKYSSHIGTATTLQMLEPRHEMGGPVRLPAHLAGRIRDMLRAMSDHEERTGRRSMDASEVAEAIGMTESEADAVMKAHKAAAWAPLVTHEDRRDRGAGSIFQPAADDRASDPGASAEMLDASERIRGAVRNLAESERVVISLHYWGGLGLGEIAAELGISRERVRQIRNKALAWLRTSPVLRAEAEAVAAG